MDTSTSLSVKVGVGVFTQFGEFALFVLHFAQLKTTRKCQTGVLASVGNPNCHSHFHSNCKRLFNQDQKFFFRNYVYGAECLCFF